MSDDLKIIEARADALVASHDLLLHDLIALRHKHQLSQEDVALRMGVSQPAVSKFERYDANPTLATVRRYALAVDALIEHEVVDDCSSSDTFDSIVGGSSFVWSKAPTSIWRIPSTRPRVEH